MCKWVKVTRPLLLLLKMYMIIVTLSRKCCKGTLNSHTVRISSSRLSGLALSFYQSKSIMHFVLYNESRQAKGHGAVIVAYL